MGAYATGIAVTAGPWLLTTMVLVLLRVSALRSGVGEIHVVETIVTVVYATVLVLGAPANIVVSRFASDCLYEDRPDRIAAPLRRTLAATLVVFTIVGAALVALLGVRLELAVGGAALTAVVGAQWLLLSAAGGLQQPGTIVGAFAVGAPVSVVAATVLARTTALGPTGYLVGYWVGQVITLAVLLWGTLRGLPPVEDDGAAIGPAWSRYRWLAVAAVLLQGGIWIDKVVVYLLHGGAGASSYAALAALAWLSVVPTCGYVFLQVETRFHASFRAFYRGVEAGAPLDQLDEAAARIGDGARRLLVSTGALQLAITLVAMAIAGRVAGALGLTASDPWTMRMLLIGATLQIVSLCAVLLLHYFDFQGEALAAAALLFIANGVLTAVCDGVFPLGSGYALACALAGVVAIVLLRARLATLLRDTYQAQPYGAE